MNYFAHGVRFLDRPWFLAGTAVPDWLSVADRRVRMREKRVAPLAESSAGAVGELAAGVLAHLDDDRWFHQTPGFYETTGMLTRLFREALPEEGHRPGFLGHIAMEVLLDAVLIERDPPALGRYYAALDEIDPAVVEQTVNHMSPLQATNLAAFIEAFRRSRFLFDYCQPQGVLYRLNQVLGRVKLRPLPETFVSALRDALEIVRLAQPTLLPAEFFTTDNTDEHG
ncbi:MAG: hypothetical protein KY476_01505 [Planctomycetes bacterium]|nr:hypothetical protein [Planctomycetota bacterium]